MRQPVYLLQQGHVLRELAKLQDESVHSVLTSLPFWLIRGYRGKGAYGCEPTIEMWCHEQARVFDEIHRVLRKDGCLGIVDGEAWYSVRSFAGPGTAAGGAFKRRHDAMGDVVGRKLQKHHELKNSDLTLQAFELAKAIRVKSGYWIKSMVVLEFDNPSPSSEGARPKQSHQYLIVATKKETGYFWDKVSSRERGVAHDRLLRSVWSGPIEKAFVYTDTKGRSFKHTSTMPRWIASKFLSATIGEEGCCPVCLTQWRPIYSKGKGGSTGKSWHPHDNDLENGNCKKTSSKDYVPPVIKGWKPACACGKGMTPVPAVVLDPYAGTSTTGVEAMTRGADYIAIDLDPRAIAASDFRLSEHEKTLSTPLFDSRKAARNQSELSFE